MLVLIDNVAREYSEHAVLTLLNDEDFVSGVLAGTVKILGQLTFRMEETLFETMELDLSRA